MTNVIETDIELYYVISTNRPSAHFRLDSKIMFLHITQVISL